MFELDKIMITKDERTIQFQKNGINGDTRKALNKLELLLPGQYAGSEERNKVVYTKIKDTDAIVRKIEKDEEKKLKSLTAPIIRLKTAVSSPKMFFFTIQNTGENASVDRVEAKSGEIRINSLNLPSSIEKTKGFRVEGRFVDGVSSREYGVDIYYSDRLQNKYVATVTRSKNRTSIITREVD
jgi:hypothetical protein